MKIGIIVFSKTGNTYSVAKKLSASLVKEGHDVNIEIIDAKRNDKTFPLVINLIKTPSIDKYDGVVFASFVEAFSLCLEMKAYLNQLESLENKKVAAYVTKGLPFSWTGGRSAIKKIQVICEAKNATISKTGIISWSSKKRNENIDYLIKDFTTYFKKN
jgi:flavodoxin